MNPITGLQIAGTNIAGILTYWADVGVFDYVLPFLLIFALVYGILQKSGILGAEDKAKPINAVIAIAIGLLALQWGYVPDFFSRIFPFAGVGISILLVAMILMGLFRGSGNDSKTFDKIFLGVGAVIALVVIYSSLTSYGYTGLGWGLGNWWHSYGPSLIVLIIIGALIGLVVGGKNKDNLDAAPAPKAG